MWVKKGRGIYGYSYIGWQGTMYFLPPTNHILQPQRLLKKTPQSHLPDQFPPFTDSQTRDDRIYDSPEGTLWKVKTKGFHKHVQHKLLTAKGTKYCHLHPRTWSSELPGERKRESTLPPKSFLNPQLQIIQVGESETGFFKSSKSNSKLSKVCSWLVLDSFGHKLPH